MTAIFWFRRDLRLSEHRALVEAAKRGAVAALVNLQDLLDLVKLSPTRANSLYASWVRFNDSIGGNLNVVANAVETIASLDSGLFPSVHVSAAYDPQSIAQMKPARAAIEASGKQFVVGDGNYLVKPGTVRKPDGSPYRVFSPFYKGWLTNLNFEATVVPEVRWEKLPLDNLGLRVDGWQAPKRLPVAGEVYALETLKRFIDKGAADRYKEIRDRADLSGTSHLSHALAHGEIHPRTIANAVQGHASAESYIRELAWREFYADVLWHNPSSLTEYLDPKFAKMRYDDGTEIGEQRFEAWCQGKTGYPMVDAGMRQLLRDGWVHNRVRMIVASFLVKDLHIEWQRGAAWFEKNLTDYDPASNSQGWQWTAGCGTDAAPYFRVFNPVLQGLKFDPDGDYVRKYVSELAHIDGAAIHEPWTQAVSTDYPARIVDHSAERDEALLRLEELKSL